MRQIISILKRTQGIFLTVCDKENGTGSDIRNNIFYVGLENDKKNIRGDIFNVAADFRKSYNAAKSLYLH